MPPSLQVAAGRQQQRGEAGHADAQHRERGRLEVADVAPDHAQRRHLRQLQHRRQAEGEQQRQAHAQAEGHRPQAWRPAARSPPARPAARTKTKCTREADRHAQRAGEQADQRELEGVGSRRWCAGSGPARAAWRSRPGGWPAKPRAASATATALSSAASSATRLRNFSARSSVWRISGRPPSSDSTRTPRTSGFFDLRHRPSRRSARPRASSPATAKR